LLSTWLQSVSVAAIYHPSSLSGQRNLMPEKSFSRSGHMQIKQQRTKGALPPRL
jgi:hypothetical protein